MGLLDRFQFRRREKQLNVSEQSALGGWSLSIGHQDKLSKMLYECGINDYQSKDPRKKVQLSRTMYDVFPFVKRAINDMSSMVGNVEIVPKEGIELPVETLAQINSELKRLPILSEFNWLTPHEYGLNNIITRLCRTMLQDGMVFIQDRYENGILTQYQGALIFESLNFDFIQEGANIPHRLVYGANQYPDEDPNYELTFSQIGYDYTNQYPWANPLLAGGGFFSDVLISMLIAIRNVNTRKGAPVEMNIIGLKNDEQLRNPDTKNTYAAITKQIRSKWSEATKAQLQGKPSSMVVNLPMDIELLSKAFGVEALDEVDKDLMVIVLVSFASLLEIPIEFLGIVVGSSGFSPERFKILYKIWGTKIDNIREKVKPVIFKIILNYLRSLSVNPSILDRIDIEFLNPEIRDENELQETEKLEAETNKLHTEVAEYLSQIDTNEARDYLTRYRVINE